MIIDGTMYLISVVIIFPAQYVCSLYIVNQFQVDAYLIGYMS